MRAGLDSGMGTSANAIWSYEPEDGREPGSLRPYGTTVPFVFGPSPPLWLMCSAYRLLLYTQYDTGSRYHDPPPLSQQPLKQLSLALIQTGLRH